MRIEDVRKCRACPNLGEDHVPSDGNPDSDLMIIGQSPGAAEVKKGKPFVGPCGELLTFMLDEAELTRSDIYIANALKCRPPGNRPAIGGELANCWRYWLYEEIRAVSPLLVLVLGGDAHKALIPSRRGFGHLVVNKNKMATFLSSYHPGYFIRRGDIEGFTAVGARVKELLEEIRSEQL